MGVKYTRYMGVKYKGVNFSFRSFTCLSMYIQRAHGTAVKWLL